MIDFSPEGKTERAHLNHEEDFAEAFTELILKMNNGNTLTERDNEMKLLLATGIIQ